MKLNYVTKSLHINQLVMTMILKWCVWSVVRCLELSWSRDRPRQERREQDQEWDSHHLDQDRENTVMRLSWDKTVSQDFPSLILTSTLLTQNENVCCIKYTVITWFFFQKAAHYDKYHLVNRRRTTSSYHRTTCKPVLTCTQHTY